MARPQGHSTEIRGAAVGQGPSLGEGACPARGEASLIPRYLGDLSVPRLPPKPQRNVESWQLQLAPESLEEGFGWAGRTGTTPSTACCSRGNWEHPWEQGPWGLCCPSLATRRAQRSLQIPADPIPAAEVPSLLGSQLLCV